ncbi:hypothetical protein INP83_11420 [Mucilaginibacter sp. 21P]|uniref:hypothetical protein n=1 Tax=Mucilaginibacter sp. 21P TaxID=2778902 RepID=UPI001C58EFCF|nr:hypothetical protein [Mucilaginibacter sp. 21P]QXV63718.1 hypothetical protein INP83_11420 [Mucilaginibacter sp. 21P]
MQSVYELKRFKNSRHPDLLNALKLYVDYTEPALRTDTKEIMHCLDHWNQDFDDKFYVVGLFLNDKLIGFCEFAYFQVEKLIIVDYLVIHESYRRNNTFYQFIDELRNLISKLRLEFNYIVAEVACYQENLEPPESSKLLIRLLKMSHFGVIKCNYYVPRVGIHDFESEMRSILMVYSANESNQIRKETFFQIVNAIYFKYYQRWHNLFVDDQEKAKYTVELKALIEKMEKQLIRKKTIEINGLTGLFAVNTNFSENGKSRTLLKVVTGIFLFGISFAAVALIFDFLKRKLGWDSSTTTTILTGSIGLTLFLVALLFENSSNVFSKTLEKILEKL